MTKELFLFICLAYFYNCIDLNKLQMLKIWSLKRFWVQEGPAKKKKNI